MSAEPRSGRTLPHSAEAERALVGALLVDPVRVPEAAEMAQPEDFYDGRLGKVYAALLRLAESGAPIDFVSVGEALRAEGHFEELGGSAFLVTVTESVTSSAHLGHHARIVADMATLRQLIREATEILDEAYSTRPVGESVRNLLDECESRIFRIARTRKDEGAEEIRSILNEAFRRIDARSHRQGLTGLTTGFGDLDSKLSGLNAGDLIVVAARPSMGKTAFALNVIENTAMAQPEWLGERPTVLLFSLEMGRLSLIERMLCSRARVESYRLRTGHLSGEERAELTNAASDLQGTRIFIDDSPGLSMMSLRSRARRIQSQHGLHMIAVDYLQLLSFPRSESRQQEISSISRSLKGLARELSVPVVALAQLSRAVEMRDPPRPQLADLRESGSIEQDADVVMLLYRPGYYARQRGGGEEEDEGGAEDRLAEIIVAKHRNGPTGTVKLHFFDAHMRFATPELGMAEPIS